MRQRTNLEVLLLYSSVKVMKLLLVILILVLVMFLSLRIIHSGELAILTLLQITLLLLLMPLFLFVEVMMRKETTIMSQDSKVFKTSAMTTRKINSHPKRFRGGTRF